MARFPWATPARLPYAILTLEESSAAPPDASQVTFLVHGGGGKPHRLTFGANAARDPYVELRAFTEPGTEGSGTPLTLAYSPAEVDSSEENKVLAPASWDILLAAPTETLRHSSVQTRLCNMECSHPDITPDPTCRSAVPACP